MGQFWCRLSWINRNPKTEFDRLFEWFQLIVQSRPSLPAVVYVVVEHSNIVRAGRTMWRSTNKGAGHGRECDRSVSISGFDLGALFSTHSDLHRIAYGVLWSAWACDTLAAPHNYHSCSVLQNPATGRWLDKRSKVFQEAKFPTVFPEKPLFFLASNRTVCLVRLKTTISKDLLVPLGVELELYVQVLKPSSRSYYSYT